MPLPAFHLPDRRAALLQARFPHPVMLGELGEADRHDRGAQNRGTQGVEIGEAPVEHRTVVHAGRERLERDVNDLQIWSYLFWFSCLGPKNPIPFWFKTSI